MVVKGFERYAVKPGKRPHLEEVPSDPGHDIPDDKERGREELEELNEQLADLQKRFFIDRRRKLLVVLQGMDTSGKGGTIRHVFRGVNPQGVDVASFDKPTRRELSYDYLWRVHREVPKSGEIVVFDRSHYEDVLAVRVNELQPEAVWKKRFRHMIEFERMLADEGTLILKFFLHIDRETQRDRLQKRLDDPAKNWKFDQSDLIAREKWDQYMEAYEDVLEKTSEDFAPWYIIPANRKWARNLLVARIVVGLLESLELTYPKVEFEPEEIEIK
ncbi:MAG: PPK2 family polyphosphate kinase [Verrucomicrobiota bacterium]